MPYAEYHRKNKEKERGRRRKEELKSYYNIHKDKYKNRYINKYTKKDTSNWNKGSSNPNYKGGITKLHDWLRVLPYYYDWRLLVLIRDHFTCLNCKRTGGDLQVHHIKKAVDIIKEFNLKTKEDLLRCSELWDTDNGITLCLECHKIIHKGGNT